MSQSFKIKTIFLNACWSIYNLIVRNIGCSTGQRDLFYFQHRKRDYNWEYTWSHIFQRFLPFLEKPWGLWYHLI